MSLDHQTINDLEKGKFTETSDLKPAVRTVPGKGVAFDAYECTGEQTANTNGISAKTVYSIFATSAAEIQLVTDQTITIYLNSASNDGIVVKAVDSPLVINNFSVSDIIIDAEGKNAKIQIITFR